MVVEMELPDQTSREDVLAFDDLRNDFRDSFREISYGVAWDPVSTGEHPEQISPVSERMIRELRMIRESTLVSAATQGCSNGNRSGRWIENTISSSSEFHSGTSLFSIDN